MAIHATTDLPSVLMLGKDTVFSVLSSCWERTRFSVLSKQVATISVRHPLVIEVFLVPLVFV